MNTINKKTTYKNVFDKEYYVSTRVVRKDERVKMIKRITKLTKKYSTMERITKLIRDKIVRVESGCCFGTSLSEIKRNSRVCTTQISIIIYESFIEVWTFVHIWAKEYRYTHL